MKHCFTAPTLFVIPHPYFEPKDYEHTALGRVQRLVDYVCRRTFIEPARLRIKSRNREIVLPKQVICYLGLSWKIASCDFIAYELNYRDHTTVLHGKQTITDLIKNRQLPHDLLWVKQLVKEGFARVVSETTKPTAKEAV